MWIIAKYKLNELNILKKKFKDILGDDPEYFTPKIKYTKIVKKKFKTFQKSILEGYFEDEEGFIKQDFFNFDNFTRAKFVSGPFTNIFFDILSKQSDKIEILIGKYKTTISKSSKLLYRPI